MSGYFQPVSPMSFIPGRRFDMCSVYYGQARAESLFWPIQARLKVFNLLSAEKLCSHSQLVAGIVAAIWSKTYMFGKYAWSHILIVSAILDGKLSSNLSLKYSFHLNNSWWNNSGEGRSSVYVLSTSSKSGSTSSLIRTVGTNPISFPHLADKPVNCCSNSLDKWSRNGIAKFSL
ncbi:hypothetical protein P5673_013740 [Acropora cervicornis]|uniref:Uncharacterized protein n=1 Tax=Acropora cervicornis TaxID=6130 RepID=A0AAD9QK71_ACRCE|nr:hypothetical protein P5673_013740 [Acropora cervicornis]